MKKMNDLNLKEWGDYRICKVKSRSGYSDEYLGMSVADYTYVSLTEGKSYYCRQQDEIGVFERC